MPRILVLLMLPACLWPSLEPVDLFCDETVACDYALAPEARFCDSDGSVAGVANTCIPVPAGRCASTADCGDLFCNPVERRCRECAEHAECPSSACLRSIGRCIDEALIIYVNAAAGEDRAGCGERALPCATITGPGGALARVEGERKTIKLAGSFTETVAVTADVRLIGPATLTGPQDQPAIEVTSTGDLLVDEVTVAGGRGLPDGALVCDGADLELEHAIVEDNDTTAVLATDCVVRLVRSIVADNRGLGVVATRGRTSIKESQIARNLGGGVDLVDPAGFVVQNNIIADNGGPGTPVGGVRIADSVTVFERIFRFNTVAGNEAGAAALAAGVACDGDAAEIHSNLVFANDLPAGGVVGVAGSCVWSHSNVEGGIPTAIDGGDNLDADPGFVDPEAGDYHLQPGSICRDAARPIEDVSDIDGDTRPQGPAPDIGADEIVAPDGQ